MTLGREGAEGALPLFFFGKKRRSRANFFDARSVGRVGRFTSYRKIFELPRSAFTSFFLLGNFARTKIIRCSASSIHATGSHSTVIFFGASPKNQPGELHSWRIVDLCPAPPSNGYVQRNSHYCFLRARFFRHLRLDVTI